MYNQRTFTTLRDGAWYEARDGSLIHIRYDKAEEYFRDQNDDIYTSNGSYYEDENESGHDLAYEIEVPVICRKPPESARLADLADEVLTSEGF